MSANLASVLLDSASRRGGATALKLDDAEVSYAMLDGASAHVAGLLRDRGVQPGDRVGIMLPNVPYFAVCYYGVLRAGAIVVPMNVLLKGREVAFYCSDAESKAMFAWGDFAEAAQAGAEQAGTDCILVKPGEFEEMVGSAPPVTELVDRAGDDTAVILYTSGTTGKPKGIMHTSGGYLTQSSYTHHTVFDVKPESDVYWCTADIGWVTGHTYIVYGPLANRATSVIYEGTPNTPHEGRHWEIIQKYGVSIYYTAPTLIRTFMKWGKEIPEKYDLSSLKVLGSVGEPINPEAWMWYRENVGHNNCPIVDTWWQTETGAIMISPLPGVTQTKPGSAMRALPGIAANVVDENGEPVGPGGGGYLVLDKPWPAMLRGIWGDEERYVDTYWSRFAEQGYYFAGDGAKYDDDGAIWLLGRVDDVMNVSGHRISTTEVESALVSHPTVAEAAVVGASDPTTGQGIVAFVILRGNVAQDEGKSEEAIKALRDHVSKEIGPIAKPRQIMVVDELPKTRSGKIIRRLLKDVAENREVGDVTTLADSTVMDLISSGLKEDKSED
jgi:acetyl-CoA synthetase